MFENIKEYISDSEFRFTIFNDRIHIINYFKLLSLENNRISFIGGNRRIVIKGNNFILSKMLDDEILIIGNILNIEVLYE